MDVTATFGEASQIEGLVEREQSEILALQDLQLALVGGGIGDTQL